jgi:Golgi phosphoprotein 3
MLTLPQELYLLALHEEKGRVPGSVSMALHYGLGGAVLAELVLRGKVGLDEKKKMVVLDDGMLGEDDLLNEALERIIASTKPRKVSHWVSVFSDEIKKLEKRLSNRLVELSILRKEEKRFLGVISYEVYPQHPQNTGAGNASAKYWIKQHLRSVALAGDPTSKPDERVLALLSLAKACDLLSFVFTRDELKAARRKIEELTRGELIGEAVKEAIDSIMTAVTVATTSN